MTCNPHWSRTRIPTRRSGPAWRGGDERGEGGGKAGGSRGREGRAQGGLPLTSLGNRRRRQRPPRSPAVWSGVVPPPPHKEIPRTHTPPPAPPARSRSTGGRAHAQPRELPPHPALPFAFSLSLSSSSLAPSPAGGAGARPPCSPRSGPATRARPEKMAAPSLPPCVRPSPAPRGEEVAGAGWVIPATGSADPAVRFGSV